MKTKKNFFLTVTLMMFSVAISFAQPGSPGPCGAVTPYYNNNGGGWNNINDAATVFSKSLNVAIGKNIVVGINPSGTPRTLTITVNGGTSVVKNPAGDYTVVNPVPTAGSTAAVVVLYTDACGTFTYTWNLTGVCSTPVLYYNNNIGSGWVDPATPVANNINVPGLFSTGAGTKFTAGFRLNGGVSVAWSDGLGFTSTATGDVAYYPNFLVGGTTTRTLTAAYKNNCNVVVNYTFTLTAAASCSPNASTFYYNTGDGNWHDPTTPVSNNIDVPTLLSIGTGTVFEPGIHLGLGCSVVWSDASNPSLSTINQFQYHPNLASGETKVLTATITNNCGTILPAYTYTLHASTTCIPAAYTPYYNNGGWVNAADASPINLNAEVGNNVILGINSGITASWTGTDGFSPITGGEFTYAPGFTTAGQTRDITGTFNDNCGNPKSYTFHITSVISKTTWDGTAWSYATPPSSTIDAIIAGTYGTTANGTFTAKKMTVNSGMSLTINTGTNVTVQNEVINNGSIVVENNANLVQVNNTTNTGNVVVNRNSNALYRLDYTMWSSPVASQNLAAFSPLTSQLPSRFYTYDSTSDLYVADATPTTTNFAVGRGYLIRMPNDASAITPTAYAGVFTGVPNNGNVSLASLTPGLYYAIGNPYPSTLSAELFLAGNSTDGVLYFWRKTNGALGSAYATYTTGGTTTTTPTSAAPNETIQVGQGFIVKTTAATLNFTNTMRTANNSNQIFKSRNVIERNRVWLNLTDAKGVFSQALVGYMDGATQGVDTGIDGKYINDSPVALTSNINNEDYTIQGRALPFDPSDVVALNFKTDVAGDYTIAIDHTDGLFATGQDIYLVDYATGKETNLKAGAYTFAASAGSANARFSLKYQKTLKVDAPTFNENTVTIYKNNGTLYVDTNAVSIANIKVFDIQGRLIAEQKNVKANTTIIKNLKATQQVLIVKITSQDNRVVNKKVGN